MLLADDHRPCGQSLALPLHQCSPSDAADAVPGPPCRSLPIHPARAAEATPDGRMRSRPGLRRPGPEGRKAPVTAPHREPLSRGNQGHSSSAFRLHERPKLPSSEVAFGGGPAFTASRRTDRSPSDKRPTSALTLRRGPRSRPHPTRRLDSARGVRAALGAASHVLTRPKGRRPCRFPEGHRPDPVSGHRTVPGKPEDPLDARGVRIIDATFARRRSPRRPERLDHPVKPDPGCTRNLTTRPRVQREPALRAESPDLAAPHPEGLLATLSGSSSSRPTHQEPTPSTRPGRPKPDRRWRQRPARPERRGLTTRDHRQDRRPKALAPRVAPSPRRAGRHVDARSGTARRAEPQKRTHLPIRRRPPKGPNDGSRQMGLDDTTRGDLKTDSPPKRPACHPPMMTPRSRVTEYHEGKPCALSTFHSPAASRRKRPAPHVFTRNVPSPGRRSGPVQACVTGSLFSLSRRTGHRRTEGGHTSKPKQRRALTFTRQRPSRTRADTPRSACQPNRGSFPDRKSTR